MNWNIKLGAFVALIFTLIVLGPFMVIWALNTLFQTGLGYTFWNWLAVIILSGFLQTRFGQPKG